MPLYDFIEHEALCRNRVFYISCFVYKFTGRTNWGKAQNAKVLQKRIPGTLKLLRCNGLMFQFNMEPCTVHVVTSYYELCSRHEVALRFDKHINIERHVELLQALGLQKWLAIVNISDRGRLAK